MVNRFPAGDLNQKVSAKCNLEVHSFAIVV